jgi:hypothetical protein
MLYVSFCVIPRRLNFIRRRFGTLCSIFIAKYVNKFTQKKTYNKLTCFDKYIKVKDSGHMEQSKMYQMWCVWSGDTDM